MHLYVIYIWYVRIDRYSSVLVFTYIIGMYYMYSYLLVCIVCNGLHWFLLAYNETCCRY